MMRAFRKTVNIILREYIERVRRKSFLLGTLVGPFVITGVILLPYLATSISSDERRHIAVTDDTGLFGPRFAVALDDTLNTGHRKYVLLTIQSDAVTHVQRQRLVSLVDTGDLDAYLDIPADIFTGGHPLYYVRGSRDINESRRMEYALTRIITQERLRLQGFDPMAAIQMTAPLAITTIPLREYAAPDPTGFGEHALTMVFVAFLYLTILFYGISVMRAVIDEKTSRVIEVMLASATSLQLMMGKVIGVGAAGLTQCLIWAAFALGFSLYGISFTGSELPGISFSTVVAFITFYILGFFLFATIYAGIGAISNTDQDAQQYQLPVSLFLIVPIIIMPIVIQEPNASAVKMLSLVPFFTPMLMFVRFQTLSLPIGEVMLSVTLLIGSISLCLVAVSRIFRIGILMYGKRPTLMEIGRWLRSE